MKVCPVAIMVGCAKCPVVKVCPAKGAIGDFKPELPKPEAAKQK
jgi:hypothetical protein